MNSKITQDTENNTESESPLQVGKDKLKIFVKNINYSVVEGVLESFFSKFGKVIKAQIVRNSNKYEHSYNKHSGFGYVQFEHTDSVAKALNAHPAQLTLKDFVMNVSPYQKKSQPKRIQKISSYNASEAGGEDGTLINLLPADILTLIFSRLCLRDLCIVERGWFYYFI